jgi:hypothetical protein
VSNISQITVIEFMNRVLERISGPKKEEVMEGGGNFNHKFVLFSKYY